MALDLHVHSPASDDWRGGTVTPEDFIARAKAAGLDGIAITDHNSGEWVDRLKAAAGAEEFAVFPGVEVSNLAGTQGVHLIVLFAMDTTSADIDRFLGEIGSLRGTGDNLIRGSATKGYLEVLDCVNAWGAIAVLAHSQSSKGSLKELRGDVRKQVIRHQAVLAAEAPSEDYFDAAKEANGKRVFDLLNGEDPDYRRKLAVYQSSDNPVAGAHGHCLDGIGKRYTYFYVDRPLTLESLRQCFVDREARIEYPNPHAPERPLIPTIVGLEVTGGFLDGLHLRLHSGLTTLLGSKGSGKSLAVELLRFGLDQAPEQSDILKDHETKLRNRLGDYGRVVVTVRDAGGTEHRIEREYNPAAGSPFHDVSFEPSEFFRCHFLSQGEIVRLAESENEQIRFIDSFFDFHSYQRDIDAARRELAALDRQVAVQMVARKRLDQLKKTRATLAAQVTEKDAALTSPLFAKFQTAQTKHQRLARSGDSVDQLLATVKETAEQLRAVSVPDALPDTLADDPVLKRVDALVRGGRVDAERAIVAAFDDLRKVADAIAAERAPWDAEFVELSRTYNEEVRKMGGDTPALNQERTRLVAALEQVDRDLLKTLETSQQLQPTVTRRNGLLEQLESRQSEYTNARRERCAWFGTKSEGQIDASVSAATNFDAFLSRLTELKRGSYLSGADIEAVAANASPTQFVRALLRYDLTGIETDLDPVANASDVSRDRVKVLADKLLGDGDYEALLALEYSVTPTDRPQIRFRRDDGSYAPLDELSTGQKATAFLVMALCEGDAPIIVDQPEDSLDIRSIWHDMCLRLRLTKRSRQFVFTTHNSSLAVASDSDKFVVLDADARSGKIVLSGAIDSQEVRSDVLKLLEGGEDTYFLKQRKYNVTDPSYD